MKRMAMMTALAMAGGLALAQERPAGPGPDGRKPIPAFSASPTPASSGTNASARTEVLVKLGQIQKELSPIEAKIAEADPEIKALVQKEKDLYQQIMELEKKRRELMDARLAADPKAAPLAASRKELRAKMKELSNGAGGGRGGMPGGGFRPMGGLGPRQTPPPQNAPIAPAP